MRLDGLLRRTVLALVCLAAPGVALAQDVEGSADHPMISRFAQATIHAYQQSDFDSVRLPDARIDDDAAAQDFVEREGRVTRIGYRVPGKTTALEVARSYEQALAEAGFGMDFTCLARECGRRYSNYVMQGGVFPRGFDRAAFNDRSRALVASRQTEDADIHVFLYVMEDPSNQRTLIRQLVLETQPMQAGAVTVRDAQVLTSELAEQGRTIVDGIFFETNRATLSADSDDALAQMASLLKDDAGLQVHIVGHTDNEGELAYNLNLSRERAAAVAKALVERHGIAAARLDPQGVASLSPVATNASATGRALNRRVELVVR